MGPHSGKGSRQKTSRHKKQGPSSEKKGASGQTTQQAMVKDIWVGEDMEEGLGYRFEGGTFL